MEPKVMVRLRAALGVLCVDPAQVAAVSSDRHDPGRSNLFFAGDPEPFPLTMRLGDVLDALRVPYWECAICQAEILSGQTYCADCDDTLPPTDA
jgi:hypothetical protein